jgi:hypothetical protein
MQNDFSTAELGGWISNFNDNEPLPFVTTSALISLQDLEEFIVKIKEQQADSIRVYLIRFRPTDAPKSPVQPNGEVFEGCKWHEASSDFTQATIAMVPAKNFVLDGKFIFSADDIIVNNRITTLTPGILEKGTGLNPPSPSKVISMVGRK